MTTERSSVNIFEEIPCLRPRAARIYEYLSSRRSEKSIRALYARFEDFAYWARETEHEAEREGHPRTVLQMPIEPGDLAAYAKWLDEDQRLALSSISSYVSAIGSLHVAAGYLNPTGSDTVKGVLGALRDKHSGDVLRRARALSGDEMKNILSTLPKPRRTRGRRRERPEGARKRASVDKALLLSMIGAGMRRSEVTYLTWGRVVQHPDGLGMILLPVNWRTSYLWVPVSEECLKALMAIKPADALRNSKVFNLSVSQINRRLKRMCEEAGIDSKDISGDTPRATLQRLMVDNGAPEDAVRAQLRLKLPASSGMYILMEDGQDLDLMKERNVLKGSKYTRGYMDLGNVLKDVKYTDGYIAFGKPRHYELNIHIALLKILRRMMHGYSVDMGRVRVLYGHRMPMSDILITAPGRVPVGLEASFAPAHVVQAEVAPAHVVQADALGRLRLKAAVDKRDIGVLIALRYFADIATAYDLDAELVEAKLRYCVYMGNADAPDRFPESGWIEGSLSDIADFARLLSLPRSAVDNAARVLVEGKRMRLPHG